MTFNYTSTLESVYKIPKKNITYLHNKAENQSSTLIIGHNRRIKSLNDPRAAEDADPRVWNGNIAVDKYFFSTYKQTNEIIAKNSSWFRALRSVKEIILLGHSLSDVDLPYFIEINKYAKKSKWIVSYHDPGDRLFHPKVLMSLGVSDKNIRMIRLNEVEGPNA